MFAILNGRFELVPSRSRKQVNDAPSIIRRACVQEDKVVDAARSLIGDAGNHKSCVAMTHQDDLLEILEEQDVGYILNMESKVH